MTYVYHLVPHNLRGTILYPLNQLKTRWPDIYALQVKKYVGRESLMQRYIPALDCLWTDVLHCSPVHPTKIRKAFLEVGFDWSPRHWFVIPATYAGFAEYNTAIFLRTLSKVPHQLSDFNHFFSTDAIPFSAGELSHLAEVPTATLEYLKFVKASNEVPLLFNYVPHILYRGQINVQGVQVLYC